jgi:3-oxoacyl-[acyl-carrier protein] reductase
VADLLVRSGASVTVWDLQRCEAPGMQGEVLDVTDQSGVKAAAAKLGARCPDILVNCAGYLGAAQRFVDHAPDDWLQIVAVNLIGTMRVTQALLPAMVSAGRGRIVNFGSLAGKEGLAGIAAYFGSSGGVIAFTKAIAREHAHQNIFVNCVAPGPIDTEMIRSLGTEVVNAMVQDSPMKRLGEADEVAQLVAWLCSGASRFNTGAVFDMSGGRARY